MKNTILLLLMLFAVLSLQAQSRSKLERERNAIIKKIEQTNKIIKLTETKSSNALKKLDLVNKKIEQRQSLINNYNDDIRFSKNKATKLSSKKDSLMISLEQNLVNYQKLLTIEFRKKILDNKWLYLFSAESLSDAFLRYRYHEQYKTYFINQYTQLQNDTKNYQNQLLLIKKERKTKETLLNAQKINFDKLEKQKKAKKQVVKSLQNDKNKLDRELRKAKEKRKKLNQSIEKVIIANLSKPKVKTTTGASNLKAAKRQIPWPLANAIITSKFGVQKHADLKGVKISNNGIDLRSSSSTKVTSVFKGSVIAIVDAPNNGKMIIIQHDEYYTVYANMEKTSIKNGDIVSQNQKIGAITKNKSLHFELWHNKTKLDPALWLKK